jgi:hypothetical protein
MYNGLHGVLCRYMFHIVLSQMNFFETDKESNEHTNELKYIHTNNLLTQAIHFSQNQFKNPSKTETKGPKLFSTPQITSSPGPQNPPAALMNGSITFEIKCTTPFAATIAFGKTTNAFCANNNGGIVTQELVLSVIPVTEIFRFARVRVVNVL